MFKRGLPLPVPPTESFFLRGPRQTGTSTLLRATYPGATWIDHLTAEEFRRHTETPELLRQETAVSAAGEVIVIDEVQKVPQLQDEVQWLIENRSQCLALCGSSARKVKRGQGNLLGGRGVRFELHGLVSAELGKEFDLGRLLNHGHLPRHLASAKPRQLLNAYVSDYLKAEIAA